MNKRHYTYLLACSLWLLLSSALQGQNIFQKRSDVNIHYVKYNSVFSSDTGFFVTGWAVPLIPIDSTTGELGKYQMLFSWYDWDGQLINYKTLESSDNNYNGSWFDTDPFSTNRMFSFTTFSDLGNNQQDEYDVLAVKFNKSGDTIWTKKYDSGFTDFGFSCIADEYGGMLGVGCSVVGSNLCTRVIRYDSLGNIVWNKLYNCGHQSYSRYIVKDTIGNFYIGGWKRPTQSNSNPKNARTMVFKIDSAGSVIWNKSIPGICDEYSSSLTIALDGNLLVANDKCSDQPGSTVTYSKIALYKLDKNTGDTLWHKEYPKQHPQAGDFPNFIEQLPDGNMILGGAGLNLFINGEDTIGRYTGVFIKTDQWGNMIWQRYYINNEFSPDNMFMNYLSSGKLAYDGGFIIVGQTTSLTGIDDGWIIKTDANGCIDAGCVNGVEELEEDDFRLFVYPNPAQDYVSIDLPITYNKATLQIINMQGQVVKTIAINNGGLQHIDVSSLPKGIYNFAVQSSNSLIGREKVVVY